MTKPQRSKSDWCRILQQITHGHKGGNEVGYDFGYECFDLLKNLRALDNVKNLLDIGSGNGRMIIPYTETDIIIGKFSTKIEPIL